MKVVIILNKNKNKPTQYFNYKNLLVGGKKSVIRRKIQNNVDILCQRGAFLKSYIMHNYYFAIYILFYNLYFIKMCSSIIKK